MDPCDNCLHRPHPVTRPHTWCLRQPAGSRPAPSSGAARCSAVSPAGRTPDVARRRQAPAPSPAASTVLRTDFASRSRNCHDRRTPTALRGAVCLGFTTRSAGCRLPSWPIRRIPPTAASVVAGVEEGPGQGHVRDTLVIVRPHDPLPRETAAGEKRTYDNVLEQVAHLILQLHHLGQDR